MTDVEIPSPVTSTYCWYWSFSLKPGLLKQGKSTHYAIFGQGMQGWKKPPQPLRMIALYCKHCIIQFPIISSCCSMK